VQLLWNPPPPGRKEDKFQHGTPAASALQSKEPDLAGHFLVKSLLSLH
jgi:hypothetical protein